MAKFCWAESLGNCEGKLSKEHLVTAAFYESETIKPSGLPWCKTEGKEIPIAAFIAKILCEKHNHDLSAVDAAGAAISDTMRKYVELAKIRSKLKSKVPGTVYHKIDGRMFERWLLKTTINLCCGGDIPIGEDGTEPGKPSPSLVRIAFGIEKFPDEMGLSMAARTGGGVQWSERVHFSALLIDYRKKVAGGFFEFWGLRFVLNLRSQALPPQLLSDVVPDSDWKDCQLLRPIERIRSIHTGNLFPSQIIEFVW